MSLTPHGQKLCLSLKSINGSVIGKIEFVPQGLVQKCLKHSEYFTRDHHISKESVKRCRSAGSNKQIIEEIGHINVDAVDNKINLSFGDMLSLVPSFLVNGISSLFSVLGTLFQLPSVKIIIVIFLLIIILVAYVYVKPYLAIFKAAKRHKH